MHVLGRRLIVFESLSRAARLVLLLALIVYGTVGCGKPLPDHYGCFIVDGRRIQELGRVEHTPFKSIPGTNVASSSASFLTYGDFDDPVLFKVKEENGQYVVLAQDKVELEISPIKGQGEMRRVQPAQPLDKGVYLLSILGCTDNHRDFRCYFPIGVDVEKQPPFADRGLSESPPRHPQDQAAAPELHERPSTAQRLVLGVISNPRGVTESGRGIWRAMEDSGPIVLVSLERDKAWINLDGSIVELPIATVEGDQNSTEAGNRFALRFAKGAVKLHIRYEIISSTVSEEMGCTRTEYELHIEVSAGGRSEEIVPESYGEGC